MPTAARLLSLGGIPNCAGHLHRWRAAVAQIAHQIPIAHDTFAERSFSFTCFCQMQFDAFDEIGLGDWCCVSSHAATLKDFSYRWQEEFTAANDFAARAKEDSTDGSGDHV